MNGRGVHPMRHATHPVVLMAVFLALQPAVALRIAAAGQPDDPGPAAQPLRTSADVVQVSVVPPFVKAPAGGEVGFNIRLEIADGWHLYDHSYVQDPESFYFGIDLMPGEGADLAAYQPVYPPGQPGVFLGEKVSLIHKKAEIEVTIGLPDSAEGLVTVPLVLTVQACDSRICLQPSDIELAVKVQVE